MSEIFFLNILFMCVWYWSLFVLYKLLIFTFYLSESMQNSQSCSWSLAGYVGQLSIEKWIMRVRLRLWLCIVMLGWLVHGHNWLEEHIYLFSRHSNIMLLDDKAVPASRNPFSKKIYSYANYQIKLQYYTEINFVNN